MTTAQQTDQRRGRRPKPKLTAEQLAELRARVGAPPVPVCALCRRPIERAR